MSESAIREQIAAILGAVDGMGIVHQYQRWSADLKKFLSLFKDADGKINGCIIARKKTVSRNLAFGKEEDAHIYMIRFYYGLKDADATELRFQKLLEDSKQALRTNSTLNGTCETISPDWGPMKGSAGLQIDDVDIRAFGGVLCHCGECRLGPVENKDV